jgi:hypothetical protein
VCSCPYIRRDSFLTALSLRKFTSRRWAILTAALHIHIVHRYVDFLHFFSSFLGKIIETLHGLLVAIVIVV